MQIAKPMRASTIVLITRGLATWPTPPLALAKRRPGSLARRRGTVGIAALTCMIELPIDIRSAMLATYATGVFNSATC
jgi:hypothetical protein